MYLLSHAAFCSEASTEEVRAERANITCGAYIARILYDYLDPATAAQSFVATSDFSPGNFRKNLPTATQPV